MKRLALLGLIVITLAFPIAAEAHANLLRSNPAAGQVLDQAPAEMVLEFTEDLDPSNTRVDLYNSQNVLVVAGPGVIHPDTPRILWLTLGDLPKDSYTAVWRARSATDGHITEGNIPFGIGVATNPGDLIPAPGTDPALQNPPPFETIARWLNLAMAAVAFGSLPFALFVMQPADAKRKGQVKPEERAEAAMLRKIVLIGCLFFLASNIIFLLAQAYNLSGTLQLKELKPTITGLFSAYSGSLWIIRAALILAIAGVVWIWPKAIQNRIALWLLIGLASVTLFTFSLSGHGAALESGAAFAVFVDWVHIAATVAWLGGLVPLLGSIYLARRKQGLELGTLIPRFSELALASVITLAVTGIYSYLLHVQHLDLLAATTYGRAILIKTALFAILFTLGAINLRILSPHLKQLKNSMATAFGRTVRVELAAGALLLLAVGAMSSVATSQSAWKAHQLIWVNFLDDHARVNNVGLTIYIAPGRVGTNAFVVDVEDKRPNALSVPADVILRITKVWDKSGPLQVSMTSEDGLRFIASGNYISLPGIWQVEVILRRKGFDDAGATFIFQVSE